MYNAYSRSYGWDVSCCMIQLVIFGGLVLKFNPPFRALVLLYTYILCSDKCHYIPVVPRYSTH